MVDWLWGRECVVLIGGFIDCIVGYLNVGYLNFLFLLDKLDIMVSFCKIRCLVKIVFLKLS